MQLVRQAPYRGRFQPGYPLVWVREPVSELLAPYWAPRSWASLLGTLRPGESAPTLPAKATSALRLAGVLVDPAGDADLRRRRKVELDAARAQFRTSSYAEITNLIPGGHLAALGSYHSALLQTGQPELGDPQCDRRYGLHNEPMARYFLHQLRRVVERVAGEPVKPAYSYTAMYQSGAVLPAHTDREQCEYTVSMLIDAGPSGNQQPWPLWLEVDGARIAVRQQVGDALVFAGRRLRHWRDRLPDTQASTSLLLHFVREGFTGRLQ